MCGYCGALLELPKAVAPSPVAGYPVHAQHVSRGSSNAVWLYPVLGVVIISALSAGFALLGSLPNTPAGGAAMPHFAAPVTAAPVPPSVAWKRLEAIDIHANVERTKASFPAAFPEAKVEQEKAYSLDVDHPILTSVEYRWEWGCSCLELTRFDIKDYNTWMKVKETFVPCLERGFGPEISSNPPFDYEWPARTNMARVSLSPSMVAIYFERNTTDAAYRNVLRVLDACRK